MVHYDSIIQMRVKECISETYDAIGNYDESMEMYIELYNYNLVHNQSKNRKLSVALLFIYNTINDT